MISLFLAEIIPEVTVPPRPKGLPIAITQSPTRDLSESPKLSGVNFSSESIFSAETDIKYEGYVKIESQRVEKLGKMNCVKIPEGFDYSSINNISSESREKLMRIMPETLGQANRIAGVRPTDIGVLAVFLSASV